MGLRLHKQTSYHDRQGHELRPTAHTWCGWDGDRLVMTERDNRQCHTIYSPDSFVPLLRLEGDIPPPVVSLAEKMSQQAEMIFPDIVVQRMHQLERELRQQQLSEESLSWLAMANLTPERLATQLDPLPSLPEKVHIYHCDHLGTPLALVDRRGKIGWQATRDPWGNIARENNLEHLEQPIGMQGQHYDAESGLYYNRHRYYDPWQGRYITQDPVGLVGGFNLYSYPADPLQNIDPLGLNPFSGPGFEGVRQRASLVNHLVQQGYSPEQMESILYPKPEPASSIFGAAGDFVSNYFDMREANTIGADKYFHCKANCEASKRGPDAQWIACKISNAREIFDQRVKGDPREASIEDQVANHYGRNNSSSPASCQQICDTFRPNGLPEKY